MMSKQTDSIGKTENESRATLDDLVCEPIADNMRLPEWYHQGAVIEKRVGGRSYEVWANGTFSTISPDGHYIKDHNSAMDWLEARNVKDDDDLECLLNSKAGWDTKMSRWFELIVWDESEEKGRTVLTEAYSGEIHYEFNPEVFVDMINEAIARDAQEVEA